ncbi:hypothetical protein BH10ACI1_BH10ACI1_00160 [soil metagenome]
MKKSFPAIFLWLAIVILSIFLPDFVRAETLLPTSADTQNEVEKIQKLLKEIIEKSFPELGAENIKVKTFRSQTTFFKAQFSFARYLTFQSMRTTIFVNPIVLERNAPEEGIRSILAHELAHALYYKQKNRLELVGLVNLVNDGFTAKFERKADLIAIERGYGENLIKYREWLYQNVSAKSLAEKKRNYFTPEEISLLISALAKNPELIKHLRKQMPRNLDELKLAVNSTDNISK